MSSVVYIVQIGKRVKIGFSRNLAGRLKSFAGASAEEIKVLATFPGTRADESRAHELLKDLRLRGEFFVLDYRIDTFVRLVEEGDMAEAWHWLDGTSPERLLLRREAERKQRNAERRAAKAERDAHCARLVAERKAQLGW